MLHLVSTSAGTSGIFVGASQGQGFVIPHDQSDYRAPTRLLFGSPRALLSFLIKVKVKVKVGAKLNRFRFALGIPTGNW